MDVNIVMKMDVKTGEYSCKRTFKNTHVTLGIVHVKHYCKHGCSSVKNSVQTLVYIGMGVSKHGCKYWCKQLHLYSY